MLLVVPDGLEHLGQRAISCLPATCTHGFHAIPESSQPDGWAHALGPMQLLSTTWRAWETLAPDRPPGSSPDVNNVWDAIYSAARYLCAGQDHLDDVRAAVFRYNHFNAYSTRW